MKRLPSIARDMGKFMRDFRRETNAAIKELKEGIDIEPIKVGIFDEPDAVSVDGVSASAVGVTSATAQAPIAGAPVMAPSDPPEPNGARKRTTTARALSSLVVWATTSAPVRT